MSNGFNIDWNEQELKSIEEELLKKSGADFERVGKKNIRDIFTRSQRNGGTPVDSNELRLSASYDGDEMGYIKEYGPHVEYGHRTVAGTFVPGQYFLKANVEIQRPIYKEDLKEELNK